MDFIGTEVGIKIRSAIKAKLTEIGKTVDDELIDYIMVMVANKKEESQMSKDLQPFLESDTVKFTSWLHKVLQKLEQVTVIVTDDEYKIATSAFGKVGKKRKTSESGNKKKANSKEEPKEKKKKLKHDKHSKNVLTGGVVVASNTQTLVGVNKQSKTKSVQATSTKSAKVKKSKVVEVAPVVSSTKKSEDVVTSAPVATGTEPAAPVVDTPTPTPSVPLQKKVEASPTKYPVVPRPVAPAVQRPVMMVSDDDDDDDDFINIKTDMAEEELLLEDDKRASVPAVVSAPVQSEEDLEEITPVLPKPRTVVLETIKVEVQSLPKVTQMVQQQPQVSEATVREALVAPSTTVTSTTSSVMPTRKLLLRSPTQPKSVLASAVRAAVSSTTSRPPIMSRVGAVFKRKADPDSDEEGGAKNGSVASVIKVKPRPRLPASAQAPKSLLLRAMADAQRSIATAPARVIPEPESKRPPLFTKRFRDQQQGPEMMERFAITLPNVQETEAPAEEDENMEDQSDTLQLMEEPDEAYVPELVAAAPSSLPVNVIYSPSPIVRTMSTSNEAKEMPRSSTPEFLVTLDGYRGYDYTMNYVEGDSGHLEEEMEDYESQLPEEGEEGTMEDTEKYQEQEELEQDSQKPRRQKIVFNSERLSTEDTETDGSKKMLLKSLDRCRFWPACRQGDACTFHHPTQPCKSFPNCSFGDRCIYIHPNCKFDAVCTRKDCPFTHASPRNLATIAAAPIAVLGRPVAQRIGGLTCKFYPNCSNTNCRFFHPKSIGIPCRYGRLCSKPDCSFTHSEIPPKEKMKWVSTVR